MKADFKDILAMKMAKDEAKNRTMEIEIPSTGKELTFKTPTDDQLMEVMDGIDSDKVSDLVREFSKLIYFTCDMLHDPELHEKLEIKDPYDVVGAVFQITDILEIGTKLSDFAGGAPERIKEEVKN